MAKLVGEIIIKLEPGLAQKIETIWNHINSLEARKVTENEPAHDRIEEIRQGIANIKLDYKKCEKEFAMDLIDEILSLFDNPEQ